MDLNHVTNDCLGDAVRKAVVAKEVLRARRKKADAKDLDAFIAARNADLAKQARADRPKLNLKGFIVPGRAVPALDARDAVLDEIAPVHLRQQYNKARYALGEREMLDPETTTWRVLVQEHVRLAEKAKPKPQIVAVIDEDDSARKVKALAEVLNVTEGEAAKIIEKMGG